jgi:hypothetical protein
MGFVTLEPGMGNILDNLKTLITKAKPVTDLLSSKTQDVSPGVTAPPPPTPQPSSGIPTWAMYAGAATLGLLIFMKRR